MTSRGSTACTVPPRRGSWRARLQIDSGELDSVLRLIDSQIDVSVRRLLANS
jgi:hypothetical protein